MYNSIIILSSFFGSYYLYAQSLKLINKLQIENKKIPHSLIIMNSFTFLLSGSIFIYGFHLLKISYFKSSGYK